jgi:hypothetical protein
MDDKKLTKLLAADDGPIAAVLMSRGGWLTGSGGCSIQVAFAAEHETETNLWAITLLAEGDEPYHVVYTTADAIVGVSIKRTKHASFDPE